MDDSRRVPNSYPSVFPISLTHTEFPSDAALLDEAGLPFGCMVNLFMQKSDRSEKTLEVARFVDDATKIARCDSCRAYINPFCEATQLKWYCSLCGNRNNINRSMSRYRHTDVRALPETREMVYDYPMPFREVDSSDGAGSLPPSIIGLRGVMAEERPLVHVFVVQESMPLDALMAVVESLSLAIEEMHPDVEIVLVTFSNRIGVHKLTNCDDLGSESGNGQSLPDWSNKVQYVRLAGDNGRGEVLGHMSAEDILATSSSITSPSPLSKAGFSKGDAAAELMKNADESFGLMEGGSSTGFVKKKVEVASLAAQRRKVETKKKHVLLEDLSAMGALNSSVHFLDASCAVGLCRGQVLEALSSLLDNSCTDSAGDSSNPQAAFGPVLEAISEWILEPSRRIDDRCRASSRRQQEIDRRDIASAEAKKGDQNIGLAGYLFGVAYSAGVNLLSGNFSALALGSDAEDETQDDGSEEYGQSLPMCPVDCCSGVVLHLFLSSPQDLPEGSHASVGPLGCGIDPKWAEDIATLFARKSLSVSLWSVVSFEGQGVGLKELAPLAELTGGAIRRFVLGSYPKDEKARMAEVLTRTLTRQIATKAVIKMRTSTGVLVHNYCPTGHLSPDRDLPDVYRIAACSEDSTIGYQFHYKEDSLSSPLSNGNAIILQVAFSYDTLVESKEPVEEGDVEERDGERSDHPAANPVSRGDREGSTPSPDNADSTDRRRLEGYYGSAIDILGLKGEIDVVRREFDKQRAIDRQIESRNGKAGKRRVHQGSTQDVPSPTAVCSDPIARLSAPTHNSQPRSRTAQRSAVCGYFSSYGQGAGYDRKVRLVAVRRLRIINMMIECTPEISRVLQSSQPSTIALLIARQAILEDEKAKKVVGRGKEKQTDTERSNFVLSWASSAIASAAAATERSALNRDASNSGNGKESAKKNSSSTSNAVTLSKEGIYSTSQHPLTLRLMQLLCGAASLLYTTIDSSARSSAQEVLAAADSDQQLRSTLMTLNPRQCERIFYPELIPLKKHPSQVQTNGRMIFSLTTADRGSPNLALTRQAMVASGASLYLLDSGTDVILYRPISSPQMQAAYQQDDIPVDDPALLAAAAVETPTPTPIPTPQAPRSGGSISRLNDISNNISSNITRNVTVNSASNRLIPHPESDTSPRAESPSVDPATPLTGDTAESPEEGETLAEGSSKPSPFIISLSQSPFWVPSDLHRRLSLGPVPRLNNSEAGTSSADIFTSRLLEDTFELHLKKGTVLRGFQGFLSAVVDEAAFSS